MIRFFALGAVLGLVLGALGRVGKVLVWLIISYQAVWAILYIVIFFISRFDARKKGESFKLPVGGLIEYALILPIPVSGILVGYWLAPWQKQDIGTAFFVAFALILAYALITVLVFLETYKKFLVPKKTIDVKNPSEGNPCEKTF